MEQKKIWKFVSDFSLNIHTVFYNSHIYVYHQTNNTHCKHFRAKTYFFQWIPHNFWWNSKYFRIAKCELCKISHFQLHRLKDTSQLQSQSSILLQWIDMQSVTQYISCTKTTLICFSNWIETIFDLVEVLKCPWTCQIFEQIGKVWLNLPYWPMTMDWWPGCRFGFIWSTKHFQTSKIYIRFWLAKLAGYRFSVFSEKAAIGLTWIRKRSIIVTHTHLYDR